MLKLTDRPETLARTRTALVLMASLFLIEINAADPLPGRIVAPDIPRVQKAQINPLVAKAYQHLQQNEPEEARILYQNALAQEPGNRDVLLGLATSSILLNDPGRALEHLANRLTIDPLDHQALAGWFDLTIDDGLHESRLKQLLNQHPEVSALHFSLGNIYARQSRWSEAQRAYANACQLEPSNPAFNFNLAISLDHLGEVLAAAQHYREAVRLNRHHHAGIDAAASARLRELPWP